MLSSSWDEDREGSSFGAEEFQKNIGNIKEGLSRTKGERSELTSCVKCSSLVLIPVTFLNDIILSLFPYRKCITAREDGGTK